MKSKTIKYYLIAFAGLFAHTGFFLLSFPTRVATDEYPLSLNIQNILSTGTMQLGKGYKWGYLYQIFAGSVLQVTGLNYTATQWLSPIIGTMAVCLVVIVCYRLLNYSTPVPAFGILFPLLTVLVFGNWINAMRQTGHKALTYVFFILGLWFAARHLLGQWDWRLVAMSVVVFLGITATHPIWATIYATAVVAGMLLSRRQVGAPIVALPIAIPVTALVFSPMAVALWGPIQILFLNSAPSPTGVGEADSLISQWPLVDILGMQISLWLVTMLGIAIVATLSAGGCIVALWNWYRKQCNLFAAQVLGVVSVFGIALVVFAAGGDLATLKRLITIPAVLCVTCLGGYISITDRLSDRQRTVAIGSICALLLLSATLTLPRATTDGNLNPYDFYASDSEVASVEWANQVSGPLAGTERIDRLLAQKRGLQYISWYRGKSGSVIYDAGANSTEISVPRKSG